MVWHVPGTDAESKIFWLNWTRSATSANDTREYSNLLADNYPKAYFKQKMYPFYGHNWYFAMRTGRLVFGDFLYEEFLVGFGSTGTSQSIKRFTTRIRRFRPGARLCL
jgi:hypothetical protein